MSDQSSVEDETTMITLDPVRMFGDPRSAQVYNGPERRSGLALTDPTAIMASALSQRSRRPPIPTIRHGRGDGFATLLLVLGVLVFGATIIAGTLILYNAKHVGAFENPWDSTRVAIGLAVLAIGTVQSALLVGLSRATSYLLALLRLQNRNSNDPS